MCSNMIVDSVASDSGESSICCDPDRAPIGYHWHHTEDEPTLMNAFKSLLESEALIQIDRDRFVGEFRSRLIKLSEGALKPIHNIKGPMRFERRLSIFELRWRWDFGDGKTLRVRLYHAEPRILQRRETWVVGLHLHKKAIDDSLNVNADQDAEIAIASDRFFEGRSSLWGL